MLKLQCLQKELGCLHAAVGLHSDVNIHQFNRARKERPTADNYVKDNCVLQEHFSDKLKRWK